MKKKKALFDENWEKRREIRDEEAKSGARKLDEWTEDRRHQNCLRSRSQRFGLG